MQVSDLSTQLTWVAARAPFDQFDPLVKQLWKLLTDGNTKELPLDQPLEHRTAVGEGDSSRYVYANAAEQLFLFQEQDGQGQLVRDIFCVPSEQHLAFGARLPADLTRALQALPGLVQPSTLEPTLHWPDITQLRTIVADAQAEEALDETPVAALIAERDYLAGELAHTAEALRHARYEAKALKSQLGAAASSLDAPEAEEAYPETLDEVGQWADKYADRMILAERAVRGGKKSQYKNPQMVYQCLEHLATRYWEMKTGKISVAAHDAAMAEMPGVSLRGSTVPNVAGEWGETYFVNHNGRRVFLDLHMAKGGGMEQRYSMRIYFTWLPDEQRVLVGDLPAHLLNSLA